MEIILRSFPKKVKRKVVRDHHWYDPVSKEMFHGRGSEMRFKYDPIQQRSIPYINDHEELVTENNFTDILEWVKKNMSGYNLTLLDTADGHFVLIDVNEKIVDNVTEELYRAGINHEIL